MKIKREQLERTIELCNEWLDTPGPETFISDCGRLAMRGNVWYAARADGEIIARHCDTVAQISDLFRDAGFLG